MRTRTCECVVMSLFLAACSQGPNDRDALDGIGAAPGSDGSGSANQDGGGLPGGSDQSSGGSLASGEGTGGDDNAIPSVGVKGCVPGLAATSQLPRLKKDQYDNTIRDLVGLSILTASGNVKPSSLLEPDHTGSMTALGWSSYQTVAELVATQVMADPTLKEKFLSCDEAVEGCLSDTINTFGRRAFRRPLTAGEVSAFEQLIQSAPTTTPTGAPREVAELLLFGFLISPVFLVHSELHEDQVDAEGNHILSSHEVASRLSYLLWGSMPDGPLRQAADADALQTKEQILAQAERLLAHENAHERIAAFHRSYVLMAENTRWDSSTHDLELFPEFEPSLNLPMRQEVENFFDHVTFTDGTFQDLLLSSAGFVNAQTAAFYGLDETAYDEELSPTELDPVQRPGFLTRVGFLNSYSAFNRGSPILRGAFIVQDVLGIEIGAPPPGATDEPLPAPSKDLNTNRKQVDAQTSGPSCIRCHHTYINPIGFALENFDAIGRYRTTESNGTTIDAQSEVNINGDVPVTVSTPLDLMTEISESDTAQHHYAERWVSFAYQRGANEYDACTVNTMSAKIMTGGYTILQLVKDLTQSESFRLRTMEK